MLNHIMKTLELPSREDALPGRDEPIEITEPHLVKGHRLEPPYPAECEQLVVGMGCFWGAERLFWQLPEVWVTAVGYAGGYTPHPTYREVCSGWTGHTEAVLVVYPPDKLPLSRLLKTFWEGHDPTQGMKQGNDVGSQYRSMILYISDTQRQLAESTRADYQQALNEQQRGKITTEIKPLEQFYFAENYHQQYLAKNPDGYCGLGGCGVALPSA